MLNRISLMGRLCRSPELRVTASGKSVCTLRVAVDRDGGREAVDFIDVVAWGPTAEFVCAYFDKGGMIAVDGHLQMREYTTRMGEKRTAAEVVAERAYFAGDSGKDGADRRGG